MPQRFLLSVTCAAILSLGTLLSGNAFAQSIPSSADVGRVGRDIQQQTQPQGLSPPADITSTPDVKAPAGAEKITLVLKKVNVEGAKQLSTAQIETTYKHLIGKTITLVQVYDIANAITKLYRDSGYLLSRAVVPQQEIDNGTVRIRVLEGFVSNYTIQADPKVGSTREIKAYADKLKKTGTLSAANLERYLLLMNDLPGISVRSILAPSANTVGGADMTLVVEQDKFEGFATIDNYGNSYLGEERLTGGLQFNSLFGSSDQINLTGLWAPDHGELAYGALGIRHNIGNEGTKGGVNIAYTKTDPSLPDLLGGILEPEGEAFEVSFNVEHPFIRSRALNVLGGLAFDINTNKTEFAPGLGSLESKDKQRVLRASGNVTYLDGYAGYNAANLVLSQGLNVFGASDKGDSNLSRIDGDPQFTKLNVELNRLQRIWGPFSGLIGFTGQLSSNALLASEEFGFGGTQYGRGYDSSEITGDDGAAAKLELVYSGVLNQRYLNDYQVYTFYDIGKVWNQDPGAGGDSSVSAASAGVGTRMTFIPNVKGDLFLAKALTHESESRGKEKDDWRLKFSVTSNF